MHILHHHSSPDICEENIQFLHVTYMIEAASLIVFVIEISLLTILISSTYERSGCSLALLTLFRSPVVASIANGVVLHLKQDDNHDHDHDDDDHDNYCKAADVVC